MAARIGPVDQGVLHMAGSWQAAQASEFMRRGFERFSKVAHYLQDGEEPIDHGMARNEQIEKSAGPGAGEGFLVITDRRIIFWVGGPFSIPYSQIRSWTLTRKLLTANLVIDAGNTETFNGGKTFLSSVGKTIDAMQARGPVEPETTEVDFEEGVHGGLSWGAAFVCSRCEHPNAGTWAYCAGCARTIDWDASANALEALRRAKRAEES